MIKTLIFFADIVLQSEYMKRVTIIVLHFTVLFSTASNAQGGMPSFPEVVNKFFKTYTYEPQERTDQLVFAKRANGWSVQVIDRLQNDSIKTEEFFWDNRENRFHPLNGFAQGPDSAATNKTTAFIRGDGGPSAYGYERCRYFGYDNWDVDMINDFGSTIPANDTLLEGLARAYSVYADRYIDYGKGGKPYDNDPLKAKLGKFAPRSPERIKQFMFHHGKAIDCYRKLQQRSPGYLMLTGTPEMLLVNDQIYQYQQLNIYGYTKEANALVAGMQKSEIYSQIGHIYLNACPPNSILITYGDNDTYPLWYVQAKEGFRKDVLVLNYSLLGIAKYITAVKINSPVAFSTNPGFLKKLKYEYFYYMEDSRQAADVTIPLPTFIDELQKTKYPYIYDALDTIPTYRLKTVVFDVNLPRLKKICNQSNLASVMTFRLNDYLLLNDFMLLDIVRTSLYTRPLCVTVQAGFFPYEYLQREGSVYRVLPLIENQPQAKIRIEVAKIENYLLKNDRPVEMKYGKNLQQSDDVLHGIQTGLMAELIHGYLYLKNTAKAKEWAEKYIARPDLKKFPATIVDFVMADALMNAGYTDEAKTLVERIANNFVESQKHFSALNYSYYSKEEAISILAYMKTLLDSKNIKSSKLEDLINELNKYEE